jgi:hypothetical protein
MNDKRDRQVAARQHAGEADSVDAAHRPRAKVGEGPALGQSQPPRRPIIEVGRYITKRYRETRYWCVYVDGELLAVTVYRKGAEAIKWLLEGRHMP